MTIKSRTELSEGLHIDLGSPAGNVFNLMNIAQDLARQMGKDFLPLQEEMMSGDYENIIRVMEREFGDFITMYR